ncbi:MAG: AAA family ATPase [Acidobacteria bacterium]|nr:AAA family ATPase [Acidobacteriota bacterium]
MRLRRLTLRGVTRFVEAEVDFEALGEGLVAIAGANGAGKTTILEAPFAALFGEFPTRPGSLYGVAHGKDARLELEVENGQPYRALVAVDAVRQTSEAYLYNGNGAPVNPSGKLREYAAAVEQRFGSPRLMLSAALSCQSKRGSFLDLSKAERKDLLAEILDTAGLQRLAEAARARAKAGELALERLRGQLAAAEAELGGLGADVDLEALHHEQATTEVFRATAKLSLEQARQREQDLAVERTKADEARRTRDRLRQEYDEVARQRDAAARKVQALAVERAELAGRIERQSAELQAEAARVDEYRTAVERLGDVRERRTREQASLTVAEAALRKAREVLQAKHRETGPLGAAMAALDTAKRQAGLLDRVPCTAAETWYDGRIDDPATVVAGLAENCPLLADARNAREQVDELQMKVEYFQALEAELPSYQQAVDEAELQVTGDRGSLADLELTIGTLEPQAAKLAGAVAARGRIADLEGELARGLDTIARRREDLEAEAALLSARLAGIQTEVEETPLPDTAALDRSLSAATTEIAALRARVTELQDRLRVLDRDITRAEETARRRGELQARLEADRAAEAVTVRDLGEWALLERALGRDGIQAMEIDAAGPELSSLTNDLLHSSFTDRFEVAFVTQALRADGKGSKEVFELRVIDHERGREGSVDSLSGGEKAVISETVSLALAVYVGKHSGRRFETLFRDETAGALDPNNAHRYISMLRRARELAGAFQVIFICQQTELWEQADAVLWVEDGRIEVRR